MFFLLHKVNFGYGMNIQNQKCGLYGMNILNEYQLFHNIVPIQLVSNT